MRDSTPKEHFTDYGYWLNAADCINVAEALQEHAKALRNGNSADCMLADELAAKARILKATADFADSLDKFSPVDPSTWHRGLPPYIGWWNASSSGNERMWRWWNGGCWSSWAIPSHGVEMAAMQAHISESNSFEINWRWHYPAHARVPRIDTRTGKPCKITHPEM